MTERIKKQYEALKNGDHKKYWRELTDEQLKIVKYEVQNTALSYMERHTRRLELFLDFETPVYLENSRVQGVRTIKSFPEIYQEGELDKIKKLILYMKKVRYQILHGIARASLRKV